MTQPIDLSPRPQLSPEEAAVVNAAQQLVPIYQKMAEAGLVDGEITLNAIVLTATRIGIDTMINHAISQGYMEDPRVAAAAESASKEGYMGDLERRDTEAANQTEEEEAIAEADADELMEMDSDAVEEAAKDLCPPTDLAELPAPSEALSQPLDNVAEQA
jgi:hypothetical protein